MREEISTLHARAEASIARGRTEEAMASLMAATAHTHASEHDYLAVLRSLEETLLKQGDARAALTVSAYLAGHDESAWARTHAILAHVPPVDRAMAAAAQGKLSDAAREMENAQRFGAAAVLRERTSDWTSARALWSRLAHATETADPYVAALVRFNLARCARRCADPSGAREAMVACVRLLEEAADHFESIGQRERAFDCFQVLIEVGRDGGAFEDVLEGFVNCIRILREDHLKHFALAYFDAAIATAAECGELSAAATFADEAAAYARSLGLRSAAIAHTMRKGELWRAAAAKSRERGSPVETVAHALLAAILAFGELGQYARVGQLYTDLALLDLEPRRREHYARSALRYVNALDEMHDTPNVPLQPQRSQTGVGDVWHTDVIEWEQRGSAAEACADVMLDLRWLDLIRRKAMLARLTALRAEAHASASDGIDVRVNLAEQLGQLQHYAVLSPLEKLFSDPERRVKIAVLDALRTLFYKRSFVTVRLALQDPDTAVVQGATRTLKALQFPHAFDPLARIYREAASANVRAAALQALSQIDTPEAAELLLGVLEHGAPTDRVVAVSALKNASGVKFQDLAREAMSRVPVALRKSLTEILTSRARSA